MDFENCFRELQTLCGSTATMNLFNEHYEGLLLFINREQKPKYDRLQRMQRLLYRQFLFLFAQWREAKAADARGEPEEITARGELN